MYNSSKGAFKRFFNRNKLSMAKRNKWFLPATISAKSGQSFSFRRR